MSAGALQDRPRSWRRTAVHLGVTAALAALLVVEVDLAAVWSQMRGAGLVDLALALALSLLVFLLITRRWQILLRVDGAEARFARLLVTYVESAFFSTFLPSAIGGDLYLGARVQGEIGGVRRASVNLLTARVIGLWAVCGLAIASLPFGAEATARLRAAVLATCAVVLAGTALLVSRRFQGLVTAMLRRIRLARLAELHQLMIEQFHEYLRPRALAEMIFISLLQQLLAIASVYYVGRAAGLGLDFTFYMLVMPVVWLLGLVPAVGGIGPREAGLAYAIIEAGGSQKQAVATAALSAGVAVLRGLIGGAVWLLHTLARPRAAPSSRL